MATKKVLKKSKKKASKAAVAEEVAEESVPRKKALSVRCCELIMEERDILDIAEILQEEYPEYKYCNKGTVKYYIRFIRLGKMERLGFPADTLPAKYANLNKPKEVSPSEIDNVKQDELDDDIVEVEKPKKSGGKIRKKKIYKHK